MNLREKDFETVIFDSLRGSPLYVGHDDTNGSYTKGDYSREYHCDLKLLVSRGGKITGDWVVKSAQ